MGIPAALGVSASGLPALADKASAVLSGQITGVGPTRPFAFRGPMNLALWGSINTSLATTKGSLSSTIGSATGLAAGASISGVNVPPGTTMGALSGTTATLSVPPITLFAMGINTINPVISLPPGCNTASLVGAAVTVDPNYPTAQAALPAGTTVLNVVQADVAPSLNSDGVPGIVTLSAVPTAAPTNTGVVPLLFARTGNAIQTTGTDNGAQFTGGGVLWSGTVQLERSFDGGNIYLPCNIGTGVLAIFNAGTPVSIAFGEPEKNVLYRFNCTAYSSGTINYRISQTGGANEVLNFGPLLSG